MKVGIARARPRAEGVAWLRWIAVGITMTRHAPPGVAKVPPRVTAVVDESTRVAAVHWTRDGGTAACRPRRRHRQWQESTLRARLTWQDEVHVIYDACRGRGSRAVSLPVMPRARQEEMKMLQVVTGNVASPSPPLSERRARPPRRFMIFAAARWWYASRETSRLPASRAPADCPPAHDAVGIRRNRMCGLRTRVKRFPAMATRTWCHERSYSPFDVVAVTPSFFMFALARRQARITPAGSVGMRQSRCRRGSRRV